MLFHLFASWLLCWLLKISFDYCQQFLLVCFSAWCSVCLLLPVLICWKFHQGCVQHFLPSFVFSMIFSLLAAFCGWSAENSIRPFLMFSVWFAACPSLCQPAPLLSCWKFLQTGQPSMYLQFVSLFLLLICWKKFAETVLSVSSLCLFCTMIFSLLACSFADLLKRFAETVFSIPSLCLFFSMIFSLLACSFADLLEKKLLRLFSVFPPFVCFAVWSSVC